MIDPEVARANVRVYNELANTYRASRATYRDAVHYALGPLAVHLREAHGGRPAHVLDVGSGAGMHTESMAKHGHHVTAIDAAPDMLQVVKDNVPNATCIVADFWTYEPTHKFDCVIAASFIHLFPKNALPAVMQKLAQWLKPNEKSVIFLATVTGPPNDGAWIAKEDNHGGTKRWRVVYDEKELLAALNAAGYDVVYRWYDPDRMHDGKLWLDMMVRPRQPRTTQATAPCGLCGRHAPCNANDDESLCDPCWDEGVKDGTFPDQPNPCRPTEAMRFG